MSALAGRTALVTGASRGIGLAAARQLEALGARVVRASRTLRAGQEGNRLDIPCDVTESGAVAALAQEVERTVGPPDLVVNAAGSFLLRPFGETAATDLSDQLEANTLGPFLVIRAFLPMMLARGRGRFITIGTIADHRAFPGNAAYAASKYALRGLHEVLREEHRGTGVLFTLVSPGPTDTAAWDPFDPDARPGFTPRARMLRAADVAETIAWVATRPERVDIEWLRLEPA